MPLAPAHDARGSVSRLAVVLVRANAQLAVANEFIGRNDQVYGCRNIFENASCQIEFRTVTRTVKTAGPIRSEIGRSRLRPEGRHAAQMRADADGHEKRRACRARRAR